MKASSLDGALRNSPAPTSWMLLRPRNMRNPGPGDEQCAFVRGHITSGFPWAAGGEDVAARGDEGDLASDDGAGGFCDCCGGMAFENLAEHVASDVHRRNLRAGLLELGHPHNIVEDMLKH